MEGIAETLLNPSVIIGLFVGVLFSLVCYFFSSKNEKVVIKISNKKTETKNIKHAQPQHKQKQKAKDSQWTGYKKNSSHPSHVTTFKGHTGEVLHADFSSNGKYLATCSEDDPGSTTEDSSTTGSICSSSSSNKGDSCSRPNDNRQTLSRRQKKNRRPELKNNKKNTNNNNNKNQKVQESVPCEVEWSEGQLYSLLNNDLTLLPEQLFTNGYPDLNEQNNKVRILRQCFANPLKLYKPPNSYRDSDQTSTSSESSEDNELGKSSLGSNVPDGVERICVRCKSGFFITETEYLTKERCWYHWGKIVNNVFTCCQKSPGSFGCTSAKLHVWNGTIAGINEPLEGFVKTKPSKNGKKEKVYALDCEMCYTVKGLELCKVTVLAYNGTVVYDHFVKPENEVVDYNTRFSGVTESDVKSSKAKTFSEVQKDILKLVNKDTILIGHGLDNDLRVLKLLHYKVVDTALIFPHKRGWPFRYSLKQLVWINLNKQIQTSDSGHNPYEDALSCLELILFKIRKQYFEFQLNKFYA